MTTQTRRKLICHAKDCGHVWTPRVVDPAKCPKCGARRGDLPDWVATLEPYTGQLDAAVQLYAHRKCDEAGLDIDGQALLCRLKLRSNGHSQERAQMFWLYWLQNLMPPVPIDEVDDVPDSFEELPEAPKQTIFEGEPTSEAQKVWIEAKRALQVQVTRPSYETWLKDSVGLAKEDGRFVVGVPNAFTAEMLEQRYYLIIAAEVERVIGSAVEVSFEVYEG